MGESTYQKANRTTVDAKDRRRALAAVAHEHVQHVQQEAVAAKRHHGVCRSPVAHFHCARARANLCQRSLRQRCLGRGKRQPLDTARAEPPRLSPHWLTSASNTDTTAQRLHANCSRFYKMCIRSNHRSKFYLFFFSPKVLQFRNFVIFFIIIIIISLLFLLGDAALNRAPTSATRTLFARRRR